VRSRRLSTPAGAAGEIAVDNGLRRGSGQIALSLARRSCGQTGDGGPKVLQRHNESAV
jgi:hypothetical protein